MSFNYRHRKDLLFNVLCWVVLLGFVYYWAFTMAMVFFNRKTKSIAPQQARIHASFFNQNWRLFSKPKTYSKEINFIVRSINNPSVADTLYIEQYWMLQKRENAPFNSYEDAVERALNSILIDIDRIADAKKEYFLQQAQSSEENNAMLQLVNFLETDPHQKKNMTTLEQYGKYILTQKQIATSGKEFQMIFVRNYILPATAPLYQPGNINMEVIFTSAYKPL